MIRSASVLLVAALGSLCRHREPRPVELHRLRTRAIHSLRRTEGPGHRRRARWPAACWAVSSATRSAAAAATRWPRSPGAGAGAYAGHQVEKSAKSTSYWSVAIKMDGGNTRTFTYSSKPAVKEGERVKLVDGGKRLALVAN